MFAQHSQDQDGCSSDFLAPSGTGPFYSNIICENRSHGAGVGRVLDLGAGGQELLDQRLAEMDLDLAAICELEAASAAVGEGLAVVEAGPGVGMVEDRDAP